MNVLVTGGAGYIGSHTAKRLAASGHQPVVYDDLSAGHEWAVRFGPFERGELADTGRLREVLRRHRVEAVMHFAASALVGESVERPGKYYRNNLVGTLSLVEAMTAEGVRDLVFSSTCATYGDPERVPIDETHPQRPVNPYGESKLAVERMLGWFGRAHGLRWVALRYFNAAGADPDGELGEHHDPETHLIPLVIEAALGRRPPVKVFGADYATPDGTAVRDYVHVNDLADAHLRALAVLPDGVTGGLNLGTGRGHSVREVIELVERVGGVSVPREDAPRRPGDPPALVADASRARDRLGWEPAYSALETIVEHAWRWHRDHSRPLR